MIDNESICYFLIVPNSPVIVLSAKSIRWTCPIMLSQLINFFYFYYFQVNRFFVKRSTTGFTSKTYFNVYLFLNAELHVTYFSVVLI